MNNEAYGGNGNYKNLDAFGKGNNYAAINADTTEASEAGANPVTNNSYSNGFGAAPAPVGQNLGAQNTVAMNKQIYTNNSNIPINGTVRPSEDELKYYVPSYDLMPSRALLWWAGFNLPKSLVNYVLKWLLEVPLSLMFSWKKIN